MGPGNRWPDGTDRFGAIPRRIAQRVMGVGEADPMQSLRMAFAIRTAVLAVLAGGLILDGHAARASNPVLPAYFNPGDAAPFAPLIFMRQAPPPTNNPVSYTHLRA